MVLDAIYTSPLLGQVSAPTNGRARDHARALTKPRANTEGFAAG